VTSKVHRNVRFLARNQGEAIHFIKGYAVTKRDRITTEGQDNKTDSKDRSPDDCLVRMKA